MWRAWGIALWVLSQDPAPDFKLPDHEFSIRPPAGWIARPGLRPVVVRFLHPAGENKADAELQLTHLVTTNPTPVESFEKQARAHVAERFKDAKILEAKTVALGGRPAFRLVFSDEKSLYIKTAVHRTHLEYYLLDILLPLDDPGRQRAAAEAAVESFRVVPSPLTAEEGEAHARGLDVLRAAKPDPASLGERWYGLYLGGKKAGYMSVKLVESEGLVAFETEVVLDLGDGNRDATTTRGAFSHDGRVQRLESDQTKVNDKKESWRFRASADLRDGKMKVSRDMNGHKEEKAVDVPEGTLLGDVADLLRGRFALAGPGTRLLKTISPFADEPNVEMIETSGPERMEIDGRKTEAVVALCRLDRRKTVAYTFGMDRFLLKQGGPKDIFSLRVLPKDEAMKP